MAYPTDVMRLDARRSAAGKDDVRPQIGAIEWTARLSRLCPTIVSAIFDGTQPRTLTARHLARMASLPLAWTEQRQALGFAAG